MATSLIKYDIYKYDILTTKLYNGLKVVLSNHMIFTRVSIYNIYKIPI